MKNDAMLNRAKQLVVDYFNAHVDVTDGKKLTMEDVFIVWFSKTLQNWNDWLPPETGVERLYEPGPSREELLWRREQLPA